MEKLNSNSGMRVLRSDELFYYHSTSDNSRSHALRGNVCWTLCVLCVERPRKEHRGRRASHMHSHAERGNEAKVKFQLSNARVEIR